MFQESLFCRGLRQLCQESVFFQSDQQQCISHVYRRQLKYVCLYIYIHLHIFTYILTYINNIRIPEFSIKVLAIKAVGLLFKNISNEFASLLKGKKKINGTAGSCCTLLMHKAKNLLSGKFMSLAHKIHNTSWYCPLQYFPGGG